MTTKLEVFPGTGHTLYLEEPERFTAAVLVFLAEVEPKRPHREGC